MRFFPRQSIVPAILFLIASAAAEAAAQSPEQFYKGKNFDVVFLPDSGPGEELMVGGATKYGAEFHYIISSRSFRVLNMHFAR